MLIVAAIYGIIGIILATAAVSALSSVKKDDAFTKCNKFTQFMIWSALALVVAITWPIWFGHYLSRFI